MTFHTNLRVLAATELQIVSGGDDDIVVTGSVPLDPHILSQLEALRFSGMSFFNGELGGGGGGTVGEGEWNPDGDDDGDGIPNSEEEIVVIANTEVFNAWENWVTFQVDLVIYGAAGLAALTGIGLPVEIALGLALGGAALGIHRQAAIDFLTELYYEADAADGNLDGFTPILPPTTPQPGWFL